MDSLLSKFLYANERVRNMKKIIVSFFTSFFLLMNVGSAVIASYAAEFSTESEAQNDASQSSKTTNSTINDVTMFTEGEMMTLDDVIELSKKGNSLTLNDLAKFKGVVAGSGIFILEYDLGNKYTFTVGSMTLERIDYAILSYSGSENDIDIRTDDVEAFLRTTPSMTISSPTEPNTTTISSVADSTINVSTECNVPFPSNTIDEDTLYNFFNNDNDNTSLTDTDLNEYNLVTESKNEGCHINLNLVSGGFAMSGNDKQSFSIIGAFERINDDLYLYPENASTGFYVLHRDGNHFVSKSNENGVRLKEGLILYADNDAFWEILLDWTPPENKSRNTSDTVNPRYNIASVDELTQWVIKDYQDKTCITVAGSEVESISDDEYEILLKDADGNILDIYTINPKTGIGTDFRNEAVDLPQTGNNSPRNLMLVFGSVLMIVFGTIAVKFSNVLNHRNRNEK